MKDRLSLASYSLAVTVMSLKTEEVLCITE